MTVERRTRERILDILNGDWDELDATTRRGIAILADEMDGLHADNRNIRKSIDDLRRTMLTVGGSTITILVASAIGVFFR